MNSWKLLSAFGNIDEEFITVAHGATVKKRKGVKTLLIAALITLTLLILSFSVAFAVNEDFRIAVIDFFGLSEPEVLPKTQGWAQSDSSVEMVGSKIIDGKIEASYIKIDGTYYYQDGLLYQYADEQQDQVTFYYIDDGSPLVLETEVAGLPEYNSRFSWAEHDGRLGISWGQEYTGEWYISRLPGRSDVVIFSVYKRDEYGGTYYPMLLDLETLAVEDVFADCGLFELGQIMNACFTPDMSKALLAEYEGEIFYSDLKAKETILVSELVGQEIDGCFFIGDTSLIYYIIDNGSYSCHSLDLSTKSSTGLFSNIKVEFISGFSTMHYSSGTAFSGCEYALYSRDGQYYAIDLVTGEHILVEGLNLDGKLDSIQPSPSGKRLLLFERKYGSTGYHRIEILDFEARSLVSFGREGFQVAEAYVDWFGDEEIIVETRDYDGDPYKNYLHIYNVIT